MGISLFRIRTQNYLNEVTNIALMGSSNFNNDSLKNGNEWDNSKITVNLDQTSKSMSKL